MDKKVIRKKVVRYMLRRSTWLCKKYYALFFQTSNIGKTPIFVKNNDIKDVLDSVEIGNPDAGRFVHIIDESKVCFHIKDVIGNMPPDYKLVINHSLNELLDINGTDNKITRQNHKVLQAIKSYVIKIENVLSKNNDNDARIALLDSMIFEKASSIEDALQRILLWSSVFWQTGHKLVGIGRLDKLLNDIEDDKSDDEIVEILVDFIKELHKYYQYKSAVLLGDIGQIIILGGLEPDGKYFCNRYTYCILEAIRRTAVTDPKVLLRVSANMPRKLVKESVQCLKGANGSPLYSNDDVVIPKLLEFGYEKRDAYNYVTSACWEPVSYGNSLEQNNLANLNYAKIFVNMMCDEKVLKCNTFESVLDLYTRHQRVEIKGILKKLEIYDWEIDPLYTLFTDGCVQSKKDIAEGGALYNDYGILSVGMANAINSLMNLKHAVFIEKKYTMEFLHEIWLHGGTAEDMKDLDTYTTNARKVFGCDDTEVIKLTNEILKVTSDGLKHYRNKFGGGIKIGLSSPGYIMESKETGMTFDGRCEYAPLSVHISNDDGIAYTELVSFASQLYYTGNGANGNVVDFFVSPSFLENNQEKFEQFLYLSIKRGFFQMQMNVMGSDTLIEARKHPKDYQNLIVRVWGFSAYFVDLPEEYQELLIERALRSEGKRTN